MFFINMIYFNTRKKRYMVDRCFGYFKEFSGAYDVVVNNRSDLAENGSYEYCCIELVPEGLYSRYTARRFFKYDYVQDKYVSCQALSDFDNCVRISF